MPLSSAHGSTAGPQAEAVLLGGREALSGRRGITARSPRLQPTWDAWGGGRGSNTAGHLLLATRSTAGRLSTTEPPGKLPWCSDSKESASNVGDTGSVPESGRSPGEGNGHPLPCSCLENPMDTGAWWAACSPWGCKESDTFAVSAQLDWATNPLIS